MTTNLKILELHFKYQLPVPKIAQILDMEIRRTTANSYVIRKNTNRSAPTPLAYVSQVIAIEKEQINILKSAYFELKTDKIAI